MAIQKINEDKCIGCGSCVNACPADVIRLNKATQKAFVAYADECMICLWCVSLCKANAIELTGDKLRPMLRSW